MQIANEIELCIACYAQVIEAQKEKVDMVEVLKDFYQTVKKIESGKNLNLKNLLN